VDESTNEPEVLGERTASPPAEQKWTKGEKILCFHGPLIYEAKIQEVELQNSIPKYFIHYKGWNKNWDEWVPEARMLKFTEKNAENQASLVQAHEAREASRKRREHVFAVPKTPSPVPKKEQGRRKSGGLKPKRREATGRGDEFLLQNGKAVNLKAPDGTVETEEQFRTKVEIKIKMPEELKSYIVDDWAQVCRRRKVCVLPARTTADQLITEYARVKTVNKAEKLKNNKEKAIIEVTAGVREYFNVMLSSQVKCSVQCSGQCSAVQCSAVGSAVQ
jgi:mortality factor 4-like protein 1